MDHQPAITWRPSRGVLPAPVAIAAQCVDIHSPWRVSSGLKAEVYARPDALKGSLKQTLIDAKPTVFFVVPRVGKVREAMQAAGKKTKGPCPPSRSGPKASVRCTPPRRLIQTLQPVFRRVARKLLSS